MTTTTRHSETRLATGRQPATKEYAAMTDHKPLIARFSGDTGTRLSTDERRELVSAGLAYTMPGTGIRPTDYILTDKGREILKDWRLSQRTR